MQVRTSGESDRSNQLKRIADSLEKIVKILNKDTVSHVTIDQGNIKIKYGLDDKE